MPKTLDLLAQKGQFHLPIELQSKLASRGFTEIISKSANGKHNLEEVSFLQILSFSLSICPYKGLRHSIVLILHAQC